MKVEKRERFVQEMRPYVRLKGVECAVVEMLLALSEIWTVEPWAGFGRLKLSESLSQEELSERSKRCLGHLAGLPDFLRRWVGGFWHDAQSALSSARHLRKVLATQGEYFIATASISANDAERCFLERSCEKLVLVAEMLKHLPEVAEVLKPEVYALLARGVTRGG